MLTPQQVGEFKSKGYLHAGLLLTHEEVESLRDELDAVLARHDRGNKEIAFIEGTAALCRHRGDFLQVTNIWEISDLFRRLVFSPALVAQVVQLAGADRLRIFADSVLCKVGGHREMNPWHQDGPAFDILAESDVVAAWIAMDDVDETNGCMCMIPASHRWREPPPGVESLLKSKETDPLSAVWRECGISVEPRPVRHGEVHFHHGLTWHCSLRNESGRPRRAMAIHYMRGDTHYRAQGGHFLKPFVTVAEGAVLEGPHWPVVYPTS
ncbi:MAG: phytanoyl-CoA dioxygenase family protein [Planctomycetes bacterium]|nr:phytanoyl-CoA dioxygenase family protein [Planctomycetota bacterium]